MDYQTLNLLLRCSKAFSHEKLRVQKLSDTECMLCSYICANEGCSQDDASVALKADKTTVGKALASLERKGSIVRRQDPADKRVKRLFLTDAGRGKVAALADLHDRWLAEVLKCLSEEERKNFEDYCGRLLSAAEKLTQTHGGKMQ